MVRAEVRAAAITLLVGCGGAPAAPTFAGCIDATRTPGSARLVLNHVTEIPPPCPLPGESFIATPIRLTPGPDGLRVQFDVHDRSYSEGTYRQTTGQRDTVVVFPSGESPGRPAIELAVDRTAQGYRVDDVLRWETWSIHDANGDFRFVCAVFDRDDDGAETEVRVSLHLAVRREM